VTNASSIDSLASWRASARSHSSSPGGSCPDSRLRPAHRHYDLPGAATVTSGLIIAVYAISQAPTVGWATTGTLSLLAASAALLVGFLVIETRTETPLLPLRLFRLKTLAGSNAVGFLLGASFFSFFFIGTLYMQQVLGYSALKTGVAWLATSGTALALAGPAQVLVTRTSAKLVMAIGMTLVATGILWATVSIGALAGVVGSPA
jgi:hypothetical protein